MARRARQPPGSIFSVAPAFCCWREVLIDKHRLLSCIHNIHNQLTLVSVYSVHRRLSKEKGIIMGDFGEFHDLYNGVNCELDVHNSTRSLPRGVPCFYSSFAGFENPCHVDAIVLTIIFYLLKVWTIKEVTVEVSVEAVPRRIRRLLREKLEDRMMSRRLSQSPFE